MEPVRSVEVGNEGYRIAPLIIGGWQLSRGHRDEAPDESVLFEDLARMARAGLTTFDCADIYTGVEELLGRFRARHAASLAQDGRELQFHTKYVPDLDELGTLQRSDVERIVDRSLQRLGVERVDLVQFSWWDYGVRRYVEVAGWLDELRRAGKIRHVGVTNFDAARTREMLDAGVPLVSSQVQFSLLDRRPRRAFVELARERGMGLLCYGALAGGFLSERYLRSAAPREPFANRSLKKYRLVIEESGGWERFQALLEVLDRTAQRRGCSVAAVALAWVLAQPCVAGAMVGTFHGGHWRDNVSALTLELDERDRKELEGACAQLDELAGDVFGLERIPDGAHSKIMWKNLSRAVPRGNAVEKE